MIQEKNKFPGDQDFTINDEAIVVDDETETSENSCDLNYLREIIKSGKIEGLDLEKFDTYTSFHEKMICALLAEINRVSVEKRDIEATRKLNQLAFDISKNR